MRLAPSRAISSSVSVISPACTEEVSVDSLSMGGVSFPPPASGVFVCWAHAEGYAALFHPIKSRDPQLLRIPPPPEALRCGDFCQEVTLQPEAPRRCATTLSPRALMCKALLPRSGCATAPEN